MATILYIFNHYMIRYSDDLWWFNHILSGIWGPMREEAAFGLLAQCFACIPRVTVTVMKKEQSNFSSLATEVQLALAVTGCSTRNTSLSIVFMIVFIPPYRLTFKHKAMNMKEPERRVTSNLSFFFTCCLFFVGLLMSLHSGITWFRAGGCLNSTASLWGQSFSHSGLL